MVHFVKYFWLTLFAPLPVLVLVARVLVAHVPRIHGPLVHRTDLPFRSPLCLDKHLCLQDALLLHHTQGLGHDLNQIRGEKRKANDIRIGGELNP